MLFVEFKTTTTTNPRPYRDEIYAGQQAALHTGDDYPLPFKVNVKVGKEYAPGRYNLALESFGTDQHGNLRLNKVRIGSRIDMPPPVPGTTSK